MPSGPFPTLTELVERPDASTCVRRPSLIDVTHAPPASAAIAVGPSPTGTAVPTTVEVDGSIWVTESSLKFATHAASSEAATALGPFPTVMCSTIAVRGRVDAVDLAHIARDHPDAPRAERDAARATADGDRVDHGVRVRVDLQEGPGLGVRHPDGSGAGCDPAR